MLSSVHNTASALPSSTSSSAVLPKPGIGWWRNQMIALPSSPASSAARVMMRAISPSLACPVGLAGCAVILLRLRDRQSVGEGKGGPGRVDSGGSPSIKKKKRKEE